MNPTWTFFFGLFLLCIFAGIGTFLIRQVFLHHKLRVILEDEERVLTLPGTIRLHKVPQGVFCITGKAGG